MYNCFIQNVGVVILYHRLCYLDDHCNVIINKLGLEDNGLTTQSSSLISELTVKCQVKVLWINGNVTVGDEQQLYSMLTDSSSKLEVLHMYCIDLSSGGAIHLFNPLQNNKKLKELHIHNNDITDDACNSIIATLKKNDCLVELSIHENPLSSEAITNIVKCLEHNDTLQVLGIPDYPQLQGFEENIRTLQEVVNTMREDESVK